MRKTHLYPEASINRLWVYGDSFTEGEGTAMLYEKYKQHYSKYSKYFWGTYYLNKWLPGYSLVNRGASGSSSLHIITKMLEDIHLWREGDVVISGLSSPGRVTFTCEDIDGNIGSNGYVHIGPGSQGSWNVLSQNNFGEKEDPYFKAFVGNVIFNNSYALERENLRLRDLVGNILKVTRGRGVVCAMFDFTLWTYCSDLNNWSDGVINDQHWSPEGNVQFAHLLRDCIERGIYDLTTDFCSDERNTSKVYTEDIWFKNGIGEYIEYGDGNNGQSSLKSTSYKALLQELGRDCVVEYNPDIPYRKF